jgi:hypothetical protein
MFVGTPRSKPGEILEHALRIRMKDMRAIFMNEDPGLVIAVVRISSNMIPLVNQQDAGIQLGRKPLS